ncbi:Chlorophyllase enzyme [Amycolatopsis arida]|uniref:Chlorophyllase enzyme n=1 Tax=Amycolatopsis arida TaxID=587909 RepID=A0A1I5ZC14_9PSEU|nr:acetylxylan esterase [Amycolatopsis arida]TDX89508.1 chlorophyllase-like protein [Amycolatopsis arida]SFQ54009.1 Chlorophyllase enzyme [Amycolatopsis arida]
MTPTPAPTPRRRWRSAAGALLAAVLVGVGLVPAPATAAPSGCPSVGRAWAAPGPFAVTTEQSGRGHTVYRPTDLGGQGCDRHPVIVWGNGTFAVPAVYDALLRHLASHGFIVAAADTTWAGSGREMLAGIDYLTERNAASDSVYFGKVDLDNIGATGHSQGGGGAIAAGGDSRVDTTVPIQPGPWGSTDALRGPVLFLAGQRDSIVAPESVYTRFRAAEHVVAVYGELAGAGHFAPLGDAGGYRGPITAWFRFHLMGDEQARGMYFGRDCAYCTAPEWSRFERNARAEAVPGDRPGVPAARA